MMILGVCVVVVTAVLIIWKSEVFIREEYEIILGHQLSNRQSIGGILLAKVVDNSRKIQIHLVGKEQQHRPRRRRHHLHIISRSRNQNLKKEKHEIRNA